MSVIVFLDNKDGAFVKSSLEAVNYAASIASAKGVDCIAVSCGKLSNEVLELTGNYGASKVVSNYTENADNSQIASLVSNLVESNSASIVVFSHDFSGKAVAPRVAAKLNAAIVSGVVELPNFDSGFTVKKSVFSGKAFANYKVNSEKAVLSLLPNSLDVITTDNKAEVIVDSSDLGTAKMTIKEFKKKGGEGKIDLNEAELVVSAGRGLKGPENWGMVEELASVLGAATACSRPVADIGWRPHHEHVGQTGVAISPNLYIAIGISGAIQHLAGVNRSKVIVVINKDPEAPFFKAADYGIVGDAFEVVPKLVAAAKALN
ncbi:MAG: electron transfer flavoprotein alpha subunit [Salibacteraceae bacterium]|jgi:electron transfer flavoprotein alpha subunit